MINAQSYNTSLGMRLGTDWGISVQQRIAKRITIEGIIQSSLQREEVTVTGLVEKHFPLVTRRLNVYMGAGVHKGWITPDPEFATPNNPFGLSFIGGIEFTLGRLNISYDYKPAFNLSGGDRRMYNQSGVSMRYVINKRKWRLFGKKKKKKKGNGWKFWQKKKDK